MSANMRNLLQQTRSAKNNQHCWIIKSVTLHLLAKLRRCWPAWQHVLIQSADFQFESRGNIESKGRVTALCKNSVDVVLSIDKPTGFHI